MEGREAHILNEEKSKTIKPHKTTSALSNSFLKVKMKIFALGLVTSLHGEGSELDREPEVPTLHCARGLLGQTWQLPALILPA